MARVRGVTGERRIALDAGWEVARSEPGAIASPAELEGRGLAWTPASVPGTVASSLRAAKKWNYDARLRFDESDWWFRARVGAEPAQGGETIGLALGGLATIADVWWNGEPILHSENMFVAHEVEVAPNLRGGDEIAIRFGSLDAALSSKRGRPRWRARLVEKTHLRWARTSLIGRMPGWTPPCAAVGPWRPIALVRRARAKVEGADVHVWCEGYDGMVDVRLRARVHGARPTSASLIVGDHAAPLALSTDGDALVVEGTASVPHASRWWPQTHGAQPRYDARVVLAGAGEPIAVDLGPVAFRELSLRDGDGDFALSINGVEIFARGACWMPLDPASLANDPAVLERALADACAAGMNVIRVPGVAPYEDDAFYDACDRRGLLVWQDLALASMDYPYDDPGFAASLEREVRELLDRTQTCASLAVVCGGSETEQQPAMLGLPREVWTSPYVRGRLKELVEEVRPDAVFVPSSPTGGTMPFDANSGVSHFYEVGGFMGPIEDARRADVRFASECLAMAHVPSDDVIDRLLPDGGRPPTDPAWKMGVPRDNGAGWDHDDTREFYTAQLFDLDVMRLRYRDVERYLALSRVTSGEVVERAVAEWRRAGSRCRGAILWTMRDLRLGAGCGIFDAEGSPKAVYWFARRAFAPISLVAIDEGVNGLSLHAVNDTAAPVDGELRVRLFREELTIADGRAPIHVPARSVLHVPTQAVIDHFVDAPYVFRFGPPPHDSVLAEIVGAPDPAGAPRNVIARAIYLPLGPSRPLVSDVGLTATAEHGEDAVRVTLKTRVLAQSIAIDAPGFRPDDAYFHLEPGGERVVTFRRVHEKLDQPGKPPPFRATFAPLNAQAVATATLR